MALVWTEQGRYIIRARSRASEGGDDSCLEDPPARLSDTRHAYSIFDSRHASIIHGPPQTPSRAASPSPHQQYESSKKESVHLDRHQTGRRMLRYLLLFIASFVLGGWIVRLRGSWPFSRTGLGYHRSDPRVSFPQRTCKASYLWRGDLESGGSVHLEGSPGKGALSMTMLVGDGIDGDKSLYIPFWNATLVEMQEGDVDEREVEEVVAAATPTTSQATLSATTIVTETKATVVPRYRTPLIDRSILLKLDRLERHLGSFDTMSYNVSRQSFDRVAGSRRRPPMITAIPEGHARRRSSGTPSTTLALDAKETTQASSFNHSLICSHSPSPKNNPCKFLFPLRIAEQESKARLHFAQILHLGRELDRIVVLPNVAKSRMGACFKWPFGVYYDVDGLPIVGVIGQGGGGAEGNDTMDGDDERQGEEEHGGDKVERRVERTLRVITMDDFRLWAEREASNRRTPLKAQLVSLSTALPPSLIDEVEELEQQPSPLPPSPSPDGDRGPQIDTPAPTVSFPLRFYKYDTDFASQSEFPGCFPAKFEWLKLADESLYVTVDSRSAESPASSEDLGTKVVDALRVGAGRRTTENEAEDWGRLGEDDQALLVHDEAAGTGMVHGDPDVLVLNWELRHPLFSPGEQVPTLSYSPSLHHLAQSLAPSTPYLAIHWRMETVQPGPSSAPSKPLPKSGTFRNFDAQHDAAISILQDAFKPGGELQAWKLTDASEAIAQLGRRTEQSQQVTGDLNPLELLRDPGVLGIADKMIVSEATLFVSGSKKCSRHSSFTRQVIERRSEEWARLSNVVTLF